MTAPVLQFRVSGLPRPQGSKVPAMTNHKDPAKRRAILLDDEPELLKAWRTRVTQTARIAVFEAGLPGPLVGPLRVLFLVALHRPENPTYSRPIGKNAGDWDKLGRAIGDACTEAGVWKDDALITDGRVVKDYPGERVAQTTPGVIVRVWLDGPPAPASGQISLLPEQDQRQ